MCCYLTYIHMYTCLYVPKVKQKNMLWKEQVLRQEILTDQPTDRPTDRSIDGQTGTQGSFTSKKTENPYCRTWLSWRRQNGLEINSVLHMSLTSTMQFVRPSVASVRSSKFSIPESEWNIYLFFSRLFLSLSLSHSLYLYIYLSNYIYIYICVYVLCADLLKI